MRAFGLRLMFADFQTRSRRLSWGIGAKPYMRADRELFVFAG